MLCRAHNEVVAGLPRPTFRCIRTDLVDGWADSTHQRIAGGGDGPPALSQLKHPLISHVVDIFAESDEEIRRETISGLSDPKFYKAKSGRWRGAVYFDDDGQPWLVAAGLRRAGEATDFYAWFTGRVNAVGPDEFLPTGEDRRRLRRETLDQQLSAWERVVHNDTLDALARTEADRTVRWQLLSFDGSEVIAEVSLTVETLEADDDEPDGYGEITLEFETTNWQHSQLVEHAEIIAMCAIECRESAWTPGHTVTRIYSVLGTAREITAIIANAQSDDNQAPRDVQPSEIAHYVYAHEGRLTQQYVEGMPAKALCGQFFVPRQDPSGMPKCSRCEAVYRSMGGD